MTHEPIHYVPVSEQYYARLIEELDGHPFANQWSRADRHHFAADLYKLAESGDEAGPNTTMIPMAVDRVRDVADWLPGAIGFMPFYLVRLLNSYVQPQSERVS